MLLDAYELIVLKVAAAALLRQINGYQGDKLRRYAKVQVDGRGEIVAWDWVLWTKTKIG
jgi:hypothetical protein